MSSLFSPEVLGWAAAALTLMAFSCKNIVRLRYAALSANAAFIAYGITAELWPVLVLHFILVPINLWRLFETRRLTPRAAKVVPPRRVQTLAVEPETHA